MKASAAKEKGAQRSASRLAHRASGPILSYPKTRIRGSRLLEAAFILAIIELTRRLHQAYQHAYDKQAVDWVLPQNTQPNPADVISNYYQKFTGRVDDCLNRLFGNDANRAKMEFLFHFPALDLTKTAAQVGAMGVSGATGKPVKSANAVGRPDIGPNGTIFVAKENTPPNWPISDVYAAITHELGNILAYRITGDYYKYGNPKGVGKAKDRDTGANLEKCVFKRVPF